MVFQPQVCLLIMRLIIQADTKSLVTKLKGAYSLAQEKTILKELDVKSRSRDAIAQHV